jgi:hypothetical protein
MQTHKIQKLSHSGIGKKHLTILNLCLTLSQAKSQGYRRPITVLGQNPPVNNPVDPGLNPGQQVSSLQDLAPIRVAVLSTRCRLLSVKATDP